MAQPAPSSSRLVSYLSGKDTLVQRSDDFGETWSAAVRANVGIKESWTDKVGLAVQGQRVYVSFSIGQRYYVSWSEDGGRTFNPVQVNWSCGLAGSLVSNVIFRPIRPD